MRKVCIPDIELRDKDFPVSFRNPALLLKPSAPSKKENESK
jgi:hypothetical protein